MNYAFERSIVDVYNYESKAILKWVKDMVVVTIIGAVISLLGLTLLIREKDVSMRISSVVMCIIGIVLVAAPFERFIQVPANRNEQADVSRETSKAVAMPPIPSKMESKPVLPSETSPSTPTYVDVPMEEYVEAQPRQPVHPPRMVTQSAVKQPAKVSNHPDYATFKREYEQERELIRLQASRDTAKTETMIMSGELGAAEGASRKAQIREDAAQREADSMDRQLKEMKYYETTSER